MADVQPIRFTSRDGLTFMVTDAAEGREARRPAIVVTPTAAPGPGRWGFRPETQFLVNRGVGVLQINSAAPPLRQGLLGGRVQAVGRKDAGRHQRRRAVAH